MNKRQNPALSLRTAISAAVLVALLVLGIAQAAQVNVETWNEGEQSLWVDSNKTTESGTQDTAACIGGERDIYLEWLSGTTGAVYTYVDYGGTSDRFSYTAGDGMMARATLQWDGNDNDAIALDNDGLNNVDLTDGGNNDGMWMVVLFEDYPADLRLEVYRDTTALNWSYATVRLPSLNPGTRMDIFIPFADFVVGGGTGADFGDVGAVVMRLDGNLVAATDVSIDFCEANSVREFGDLPVGLYGASILSANHVPQGLRLGNNADAEMSYQSSTQADGDDNSTTPDDEDGVEPRNLPWSAGANGGRVRFKILGCLASSGCYVNGWIDWNNDGDFGDTVDGASEQIVDNYQDVDGTYTEYIDVPSSFSSGSYYARFRICNTSTGCDDPGNTDTNVRDGEVEDYLWPLGPTAVELASFAARWQGEDVLVTWETASEIDNAGFYLYRRAVGMDTLVQLNAGLIPSQAPGQDRGYAYSFPDEGVVPGAAYEYLIEDVDVYGVRTLHGPVQALAAYTIFLPLVGR